MSDQTLAARIAAAAREMRGDADVAETLNTAVELAAELVDGCDQAAVSIVTAKQHIDTPAATSDLAVRGDQLQSEVQEGPCLDAVWKHGLIYSPDLGADPRWTTWGPHVIEETPFRSLLCLRLFTNQDRLGALNLYSERVDGFSEQDQEEGVALAAHVAVALAAAQRIDSLGDALISRTVIGQAQGILMERFQIDAAAACATLARVSRDSNVKLHRLASELVLTRKVPGQKGVPRESGNDLRRPASAPDCRPSSGPPPR